jgi:hypothetical protein
MKLDSAPNRVWRMAVSPMRAQMLLVGDDHDQRLGGGPE